jgi:Ion channel
MVHAGWSIFDFKSSLGFAVGPARGMNMLRQFLVGGGVSLVNIAIHALIMTMVVQVARAMGRKRQPHSSLVLIAVMIPTISVLMAAHTIEVFVWALAYLIFGAAPEGVGLVYFAFGNYATLGYGDVLPVERWRLLGPLTAMNGMLLYGWSTAVIFEVLRRTLVRTLDIND